MTTAHTRRTFRACVCLLVLFALRASVVFAQDPQNTQDAREDPAALQPAEPEYRLINVPTTMLLPRNKMNFDLTHRFAGNLRGRSFQDNLADLFGIDQGAIVGLELRYGVWDRLQAAFYRTSFDRTIQLHGKWDAIRQHGASPVSISGILSVEATGNFSDDKTPAFGASISRKISDVAAVYATPIYVDNVAPRTGNDLNTFYMGIGGRVRVRPTVYVTAEVAPRLHGYEPGEPLYGFSIEKRAGGHMFQLNFTNGSSTTYAQMARGGFSDSLYLGFNLARKFF